MTLARRLDTVEDNLSPQEAAIRWMREAHEFHSWEAYARWLIDQPADVYPLLRLPRQVVGAVRARNKGVPDVKLRSEFYQVQKDVLFLYFIHKRVEMRALTMEKHELDQARSTRPTLRSGRARRTRCLPASFPSPGPRSSSPTATSPTRTSFIRPPARTSPSTWRRSPTSARPTTTPSLVRPRPMMSSGTTCSRSWPRTKPRGNQAKSPRPAPMLLDVSVQAKLLAEQWVPMAKAETLEKLGA